LNIIDFDKIDGHCHVGYYGGFFDVGITVDGLIDLMDRFGFVKSVLCSKDNEKTLNAIERYPDRFIGKVWVNPYNKGVVDEIGKYVNQGCKAVKIHPLVDAFPADSNVVDTVAETALDHDIPLFVHSGHPPFSLPNQIANLAKKHPDLDIVLIHMGHGHGIYIENAIQAASEHSNLYLETSGMPMHTKIKEAFERTGINRVLFGTDIPFHHPSVELKKTEVAELTNKQKKHYLRDNIKKLIKK